MPSKPKAEAWVQRAVAHWSGIVPETDTGVDWSDAHDRCWRCGCQRKLQRCHIVAKQFGGGDSVENIIPLCAECHDEAPDVTDPKEMWRWIARTRPTFYGTLNAERAVKLLQERGVDLSRFSEAKFRAIAMEHCGLHLMQNGSGCRVKPSTLSWAVERACE